MQTERPADVDLIRAVCRPNNSQVCHILLYGAQSRVVPYYGINY